MQLKELPFSMKPVGWFQIGWSDDIPAGSVKPLRYFSQDLVAFRGDDNILRVMNAHCHHLGAHLGHGGKVVGNEVQCPYHGWVWNGEGRNTHIPYQENCVNKRLKTWHVHEQHGCIFLWHDPTDSAPRWDLPHMFDDFREFSNMGESDFYPLFPEGTRLWPGEKVHPQITFENSVDSMHFRYVHDSPMDPVLLEQDFRNNDSVFRTLFGFKSLKTGDITMQFDTRTSGVGCSFNVFKGSYNYRVLFCGTPVDDETSDLFNSIWWPRREGDASEHLPEDLVERISNEILTTVDEDLLIWRHQAYVDRPLLAKQDVKAFTSLRQWQKGFYDLPKAESRM
jgi:3-ketosteroid 9alpha-monooxygenase subunit A